MSEKETKQKNREPVKNKTADSFIIKATRFGWKDFVVNLCFTIIMLASYMIVAFITPPSTLSDWILASATILIPLVIFVNRAVKELTYTKDYIKVANKKIEYRSTPLLTTGLFKIKKGEIALIETRKAVLTKIPRKLSIDLFRHKKKAILVLSLRNGKQHIIGEYMANEDLFNLLKKIYILSPKLKIAPETFVQYPELEEKLKRVKEKRKEAKKKSVDDLEGASIRR